MAAQEKGRRPVNDIVRKPLTGPAQLRYDARSGVATLAFPAAGSDASRDVEVPLDRLALISHYLRARVAFESDVEMAETLGIDRTRIIAWKKGASKPRHEQLRFLADVATTVDALRRFLHPSVVSDWLVSPKIQLGDRTPVDLLREGRLADVLQAVNADEHGSYA